MRQRARAAAGILGLGLLILAMFPLERGADPFADPLIAAIWQVAGATSIVLGLIGLLAWWVIGDEDTDESMAARKAADVRTDDRD